jgi:hypothetical protein
MPSRARRKAIFAGPGSGFSRSAASSGPHQRSSSSATPPPITSAWGSSTFSRPPNVMPSAIARQVDRCVSISGRARAPIYVRTKKCATGFWRTIAKCARRAKVCASYPATCPARARGSIGLSPIGCTANAISSSPSACARRTKSRSGSVRTLAVIMSHILPSPKRRPDSAPGKEIATESSEVSRGEQVPMGWILAESRKCVRMTSVCIRTT